jgi:hypothetical protein
MAEFTALIAVMVFMEFFTGNIGNVYPAEEVAWGEQAHGMADPMVF